MFIGEAPGQREDDSGKPFVGRSGQKLTEITERVGLDREDVYITNAVHCRPPENRKPKAKEIEACKKWLDAEISNVKPKFVLLLGGIPLLSVLGKKGIKKYRGKPIEENGIIYLPTYHPSYALRDPRAEPVLEQDMKLFKQLIDKGSLEPEQGLNFTIVDTDAKLERCIKDLKKNRIIAFDTETSGLEPRAPGSYITSLGFATRTKQWCIPLQHTEGPWYNDFKKQKQIVRRLDPIIKRKKLIAQFGKFDTKWMATIFEVWWDIWFDTGLAHYNLDENAPHDLEFIANLLFGAIAYDIPLEEKHGLGPIERHCKYLASDVFYTRKAFFIFDDQLREDEGTHRIFWNITMPASRMFARSEWRGLYLNRERLRADRAAWQEQASNALDELNRLAPSDKKWKNKKTKEWQTGINWASPQQVADLLFNKLGMSPLDETNGSTLENPKYSVSESVLNRLATQKTKSNVANHIPKLLVDYREAMKNISTYRDGWEAVAYDGRMHAHVKLHGTVTGRPSVEDPAVQQTPRNPRIRSVIDATPGYILVEVDLSQAELRFTAHDSGDQELKLAYQTGTDVHTLTVQRVFGIEKPSSEERKKGKAVNFGFVYGMWWRKFILYARDNYGVHFTDEEAQEVRRTFFRTYRLEGWHDRKKRFARRNGYVRSIFGRKRRLPLAMSSSDTPDVKEAQRQAINSPIQSAASDWNLAAAIEMYETFPDDEARVMMTVHDSILLEVRKDVLTTYLHKIKKIMEAPKLVSKFQIELSVPMVCDLKVGPWGSGEEVHDIRSFSIKSEDVAQVPQGVRLQVQSNANAKATSRSSDERQHHTRGAGSSRQGWRSKRANKGGGRKIQEALS